MIVNKYINDLKIEFALSNLDLFIFDKIGSRSEGGGDSKHYIGQKFLYRKIKKDTEEYLRENYDAGKLPMFSSVEIEVINRCNGECPFCPVNKYDDPRKLKKMDTALFKKIIDELGKMNYRGRLALHSNNEPFLDDRIIEFAKYAREHVPKAYIYMYTNGTLLSLDKFNSIIDYLDKMIIDNYDDNLQLSKNAKRIDMLCRENGKLNRKVEIHVRKVHEVLSTRGGQSPNNRKRKTIAMSCVLPYKQLIIRPDGKTSLCCNDSYGKNTMADLCRMTLKEAWYSERYEMVRKALRKGRKKVKLCQYCDTLADVKTY